MGSFSCLLNISLGLIQLVYTLMDPTKNIGPSDGLLMTWNRQGDVHFGSIFVSHKLGYTWFEFSKLPNPLWRCRFVRARRCRLVRARRWNRDELRCSPTFSILNRRQIVRDCAQVELRYKACLWVRLEVNRAPSRIPTAESDPESVQFPRSV